MSSLSVPIIKAPPEPGSRLRRTHDISGAAALALGIFSTGLTAGVVLPIWRWLDPIEAAIAAQGIDDPVANSVRWLLAVMRVLIGVVALAFLIDSFAYRREEGPRRFTALQILAALLLLLLLLPCAYTLFRFLGLPIIQSLLRWLFLPQGAP